MHTVPGDTSPRFLFRWLPAIAWLITCVLYAGMTAYLAASTSRRLDAPWSSWLFVAGLSSIAVCSLVITVRATRDARAMAWEMASIEPDWPATLPMTVTMPPDQLAGRARRSVAPVRSAVPVEGAIDDVAAGRPPPPDTALAEPTALTEPAALAEPTVLAEPVAKRLTGMLEALEAAGILVPGEVPVDVALDALARMGHKGGVGLDELLSMLGRVRADRGRGFAHLVLFPTQGDVSEQQLIQFVEDVARLAGRLPSLGAVELRGIGGGPVSAALPAEVGPVNAVIRFALDGRWYAVPFVMLPAFPLNLIEGLAGCLVPADGPQGFVDAWTEGFVAISCIDRDRLAALDAALAWNGETFGMVIAVPGREVAAAPATDRFFRPGQAPIPGLPRVVAPYRHRGLPR